MECNYIPEKVGNWFKNPEYFLNYDEKLGKYGLPLDVVYCSKLPKQSTTTQRWRIQSNSR